MNKNILICLLVMIAACTGCFSDEGNYTYDKINQPLWAAGNQPYNIPAREGEEVVMDGHILLSPNAKVKTDLAHYTYEWYLNDHLVSNELKLTLSTEELMEKCGIKSYSQGVGTYGKFIITDKRKGYKFIAKILVNFYSKYSDNDWIILAEKDGKTVVTAINQSSYDNPTFKAVNKVVDQSQIELVGKPVRMNWARDKHFGSQGSITIITEGGAYLFRAENMKFEKMLGDEDDFLSGVPSNFNVVDRADCDGNDTMNPGTFVITKDGKLYTRMMSKNYLGGKFLSEPYFVDDRGYKISKFGNGLSNNMIPCYDEKNRRMLAMSVISSQEKDEQGNYIMTNIPKVKAMSGMYTNGAPIGEFPEGTVMLYIGKQAIPDSYVCVYNSPENPSTIIADFDIDKSLLGKDNFVLNRFAIGASLDNTSCFVTSSNYRNIRSSIGRTMYLSKGAKIIFIQRNAWAKMGYKDLNTGVLRTPEITSPITYMTLDYVMANRLFVGCQNGDVLIYDISAPENAVLVFKANFGAKIINAKQLGQRNSREDKFNY